MHSLMPQGYFIRQFIAISILLSQFVTFGVIGKKKSNSLFNLAFISKGQIDNLILLLYMTLGKDN